MLAPFPETFFQETGQALSASQAPNPVCPRPKQGPVRTRLDTCLPAQGPSKPPDTGKRPLPRSTTGRTRHSLPVAPNGPPAVPRYGRVEKKYKVCQMFDTPCKKPDTPLACRQTRHARRASPHVPPEVRLRGTRLSRARLLSRGSRAIRSCRQSPSRSRQGQ